MLTPKQLEALPEEVVRLYRELEEFLIADIARRIGKALDMTDTAYDQLVTTRRLGIDVRAISKRIQEVSNLAAEKTEELMREAMAESIEAENVMYAAAGKDEASLLSPALSRLIDEGIRQTLGTLKNLSGSMGFAYTENGRVKFQGVADMYQNEIDLAIMKMRTGASDRRSAARQAVKHLTERGLSSVNWESGHVDTVDVAVERAVRTGASQMATQATEQVAEQLGAEYVEVTAHSGARPDHAVWQGRVYRWNR